MEVDTVKINDANVATKSIENDLSKLEEETKLLCIDENKSKRSTETGLQDDIITILFNSQVKTHKSLSDNQGVLIGMLDRIKALENKVYGEKDSEVSPEESNIDYSKEVEAVTDSTNTKHEEELELTTAGFQTEEFFSSCSSVPLTLSTCKQNEFSVESENSVKSITENEPESSVGPVHAAEFNMFSSSFGEQFRTGIEAATRRLVRQLTGVEDDGINNGESSQREPDFSIEFQKFEKEQEEIMKRIEEENEAFSMIVENESRMRMEEAQMRFMEMA